MGRSTEAWREQVVAARAQTLVDLMATETSSTALLVGEDAGAMAGVLEEDAAARGAVTATVSLLDHAFHELDAVLSAVAATLRLPGHKRSRRHGLMQAITVFAEQHRKKAEARFVEAADTYAVSGPLRELTAERLAVLSGKSAGRLTAWLRGKDLSADRDELALRSLSPRTAKRGLVQLTRLVRALGYPGIRIVFRDAESLVELSRARREVAYTVLRELIDNADSRRGMVSTELLLLGSDALLRRKGGVNAHPALASRLLGDATQPQPLPHAPLVTLDPPSEAELPYELPALLETPASRAGALRATLRMAQGLPPYDEIETLSVGMEAIDARLDKLFSVTENDGSVFALLSGPYGSGKTHHLLHLEGRALQDQRPVLRLSVERLDEDLGNPQRHLRRLLEGGVLPIRRRASPLDRLDAWLANDRGRARLTGALTDIAALDGEAAPAALRALGGGGELDEPWVRTVLGAVDLESKPGNPSYRRDAYQRLQLWLALIERIEGCDGPVLILDEAENLFRAGVSRAERRTALRSLGFYCGGGLARACVVLAVTPETLELLTSEAGELLDELDGQTTLLPEEDVSMLRRRLRGRPIKVPPLGRDDLRALAEKAYKVGRKARGLRAERDINEVIEQLGRGAGSPREVVRRVAAHVERRAWADLP